MSGPAVLVLEDGRTFPGTAYAATGVTTGAMLRGVRRYPGGAVTHSIVMRSKSGTVRYVEGHHNFAVKRPVYAP